MKYFMAAIEARISDPYSESVKRGNVYFNSPLLTKAVLDEAKTRYCKDCSNTMLTYYPDQAFITFVCEIAPPK